MKEFLVTGHDPSPEQLAKTRISKFHTSYTEAMRYTLCLGSLIPQSGRRRSLERSRGVHNLEHAEMNP